MTEEKKSSEKENVVKQVLENEDVKKEVEKKIDLESEEKAKRMFLKKKIEDASPDKLMKDLESYAQLEKEDFKSIVSQREKLISDYSSVKLEDLESISNRIDTALKVENSFRKMDELYKSKISESKPTVSSSDNSLPETLDEIISDPSRFENTKSHICDKLYLTKDPHKEFKTYEKSDLCSVNNDDCREASETWYKEFVQSKNRNKAHSKNILTKII